MHIELAKEIVNTCRQREREGDHPTVEVPPTELLESCIIELAARLGIEAPMKPRGRYTNFGAAPREPRDGRVAAD